MRIDRRELVNKLKTIKSVIPKEKEQLIYGVLYDNGTVIADNANMRIEAKLDVQETLTDDKFVIPAKAVEYIECLSSDYVDIDASKTMLTIKTRNGSAKFAALNADEFLERPQVTEDSTLITDAEDFTYRIAKVLYACAAEGFYSGPLIRGTAGGIDLVGCDGFCLAKNEIHQISDIDVSVPKEAIKKLIQLDLKGELKITQSKTKTVLSSESYTIYASLLTGKYIEYQKLFSIGTGHSATVNRLQLAEIIKRVKVLIQGNKTTCMVIRKKDENLLTISAKTSTVDFSEDVEYSGELTEGFEMGINSTYLENAVHELEGDTVTMQLETAVTPCEIKEGGFNALILPVRLKKKQVENNDQ